MSAGVIIANTVSALLLPPLNAVLLCGVGCLVRQRYPHGARNIIVSSVILLIAFSTKAGAILLSYPLEHRNPPLTNPATAQAQAIVVLGGGKLRSAPEYGGKDSPNDITFMRLRYAAKLQRETGLPLLVTGGTPDGVGEPEAVVMVRALQEDFSVPVKWVEQASNNTAENALFSEKILNKAGIKRVLLVTDAMHMPRAESVFAKAGFEVVPAPTNFFSYEKLTILNFLPGAEGLRRSHYALHEWIGLVWYGIRHAN